jgi:RHS repeat-associated protein
MYDDENRLTGVDVSPGNPPTPGAGTITISGAEQRKNNCLAPVGGFSSARASPQSCPWIYDYGSVSITINGYRQSVPYSQGSTASGIASSLINAFNNDPASPVTASGGTTITFTSKQVGSGSNYGFSTSVTYDTRDFTQPSFAASPTSGSLTGGSNGTPPGTPNYFYDAEGRRIRKTTAGATVDYIYDLAGHVVSEVSSAGGWNRGEVYAGGRHLATYTGGTTYFDHTDWLGTERARTGVTGSSAETCTSLPFGDGQSCSGSDVSPNHFTGKERDSESGLDMFGARYYGSSFGRFMTPDWAAKPTNVPYANFGNPQSLNLYSYVQNNPTTVGDPDGHCGAPSGLQAGQTGICVASYIQTKWFHAPFRGDGRTTSPNGGTSRVEVRLTVDSKNGVTKTDDRVGVSGLVSKDLGPQGRGGSTVGKATADDQGNSHFRVSQHGESAYKDYSLGIISGTIDNHINLDVTPEGKVGIDAGSTARDFPSLEIYSYSMDSKGNISSTLILDRPEASPNDKNGDLGKPEQPIKEQEPK